MSEITESLEDGLLLVDKEEEDEREALYRASFEETEDSLVNYQTAKWVLYCLLFMLAWGVGLIMLLYLPLRRFILRKDVKSRKLYVTPHAIVYKVTRPVPFPCFGVLKKEKYALLPSVADIVIEQGYLQSFFGVYSVRIENAGVRRPPSDDLQIQGIADPSAFRKAVLTHLASLRTEALSRQVSLIEDASSLRADHLQAAEISPAKTFNHDVRVGDLVLFQKLEEVGTSIKRVETLIEEQQSQPSQPVTCAKRLFQD